MNITFYLKKILVKLYLRKTIMGKMNILDPITPLPASDDFFHLIVDPYKSRFFFQVCQVYEIIVHRIFCLY